MERELMTCHRLQKSSKLSEQENDNHKTMSFKMNYKSAGQITGIGV